MGNESSKSHKDKYKKNVHWKSAVCPQPPGRPYLLPGLPTDESDVVTIKWQRPLNDGGSAIIGYVVEHKRTGSPNWVRATQQLVQMTELSLSGLEPGWRYQFRVLAENAVGRSDPSESSEPLTVTLQKNATLSAPRFISELEDLSGIENEKVEFKVRVVGLPPAQISWFKDGFEIFSSRRAKIVTENDTSTLVFYQASLTDEGEIKCTATNRIGYSFTKAKLTIEAPPKIRLPRQYEDGLIIEAEEVVRMKVGIAGRPLPSVQWSHNGENIVNGGRYEIVNNDKNSTLKISNTNRSDRGEYNLRAINKLGEDGTSFLVTVTARPTPPGKVEVKLLLGNTVTLSWAQPADDGGCKIGNYIVEYFRIGWNVWLKAATCRSLAVTLNDLIAGSEYKFRVKAENPYGVSDPGEDSDILFVPDVKRGITEKSKLPSSMEFKSTIPIAPKRRTPSPSPVRSMLTENIEQKKPSPIPQIKLNTKIFDDETISHDMSYGAADDFYKFREVPSSSLHETSGLEKQSRQLKTAKNNVKFEDTHAVKVEKEEVIYENLRKDIEEPQRKSTELNEFKFTGKRTYLDLSKTGGSTSIQNSSEFMLVLYPEKESINGTKDDSFELEDYYEPPKALSQSAPELNCWIPDGPILRTAVSSTELLYERAMARFYKAIEYEQSENARKRSISVEQETKRLSIQGDPQDTALTRLRINSLTENERKSVLRRRLSGENPSLHINIPKRLSLNKDENIEEFDKTYLNTLRNEINTPEMFSSEEISYIKKQEKEGKEKFSDDYTDSTASSEDEDISPRRSRARTQDKDTYHARMLSPYRQPQKDEAAEVLSKLKSPLPDPNFVPKPILKRPLSADGRKPPPPMPQLNRSPSPPLNRAHRKSVEIDDVPTIIQAEKEVEKEPEVQVEVPEIKVEEPKVEVQVQPEPEEEEEFDPEILRRAELAKRKLLERRQSSIEENKVVADFYGDIIKSHASPTKPKVPIYMDPEALKKLDTENEQQNDSGVNTSSEISPQSTLTRPFSPTIEIKRSPSPINRRISDSFAIQQPLPVSNDFERGRRASDTIRTQPLVIPATAETFLMKSQKDTENNTGSRQKVSTSVRGSREKENEDGIVNTSTDDVQVRGRQYASGTIPKRRKASQSRSRDSSTARTDVHSSYSKIAGEVPRRVVSSSKTRNRSESKSPACMQRKIIINRFAPTSAQVKGSPKDLTPSSQTPVSSRTVTPSELQEEVDVKVKTSITYATDVSILAFATYLYFFKSAFLALPILILLIYRQIADKIPD